MVRLHCRPPGRVFCPESGRRPPLRLTNGESERLRQLLVDKDIATVLIHQLECTSTATGDAG
jgi:hypothetical protein